MYESYNTVSGMKFTSRTQSKQSLNALAINKIKSSVEDLRASRSSRRWSRCFVFVIVAASSRWSNCKHETSPQAAAILAAKIRKVVKHAPF